MSGITIDGDCNIILDEDNIGQIKDKASAMAVAKQIPNADIGSVQAGADGYKAEADRIFKARSAVIIASDEPHALIRFSEQESHRQYLHQHVGDMLQLLANALTELGEGIDE